MSSPDRYLFRFDHWWKNMRRAVRRLGTGSLFYGALRAYLLVMDRRAAFASWLYRQRHIETSDGTGLTLWGQRLEIQQIPGESETAYRARLLAEYSLRTDPATVAAIRRRILSVVPELSAEDVVIESVYDSEAGRNTFYMGGPLSTVNARRRYVTFRYRITLPPVADPEVRYRLNAAVNVLNLGGNVPEFHEAAESVDFFAMGSALGDRIGSRRSEVVADGEVF